MKNKTTLAVVVACFAFGLAGCADMQSQGDKGKIIFAAKKARVGDHPHKPARDCKNSSMACDVTIQIDCEWIFLVLSCVAYPLDEVIMLTAHGRDDRKVTFTISDKDYKFASKGIDFDHPKITCDGNDKKWECTFKRDLDDGVYKYTLRVDGLDDVDPWVVNY